jgi:tRNA nucleotidyltransferase (CCA-adding enzyme)
MSRLEAPPAVRWIVRTLEEAGYETWAVGGAVRDALAGHPSGDWDLTTRARPKQVRRLFRRTVPIGIDHGTVGVLSREGVLYEVTTFRRDVETTGRHAVVAFAEELDDDLARRDFTINAVAWHPLREVLHDPYGGASDLERRVLRTVGIPGERFAEDYLRVLRALRFAGHFLLEIEPATWTALSAAVPRTGLLSPERVREELEKVLEGSGRASAALSLYAASGLLGFLLPELEATVGFPVDAGPGEDPWSRALRMVDLLPSDEVELRVGALLHAVGLPPSGAVRVEPGGISPGDAARESERGALRAAALLTRLRSSNERIRRVGAWVAALAASPPPGAPVRELRRWLASVGRADLPGTARLLAARARARAVVRSGDEGGGELQGAAALLRALRREVRSDVPLTVDELAFSGRELIRMGHRPGPAFGVVLRTLLDEVLEEPARNDPTWLAERAAELLGEPGEREAGRGR